MPFLYLFLSACCSLLIVHLLKVSEFRGLRTLNTLMVNYLVAAVFALGVGKIWEVSIPQHSLILLPALFCIAVGAIFIGNFIVYSKSIHVNGMGISIAAMRISLLVPVFVSIIFYADRMDWTTGVGGILVLIALILLIPQRTSKRIWKINAGWLLLITFFLSGLADASLKIYQEEFSVHLNELSFMGLVFAGAFVIGLCIAAVRKGPLFKTQEFKIGVLIGIPNLYSSIFLIYALGGISGAVAFPLVNTLNVLGGTIWGLIWWGDRVDRGQWIGIVIAILAVILLI